MSTTSRRTTLAMLGLAPAAAIGVESFNGNPIKKPWSGSEAYSTEAYVRAFRSLADQIEQGRIDIETLDVSASLKADDIVRHVLSVSFWYRPDSDGV